MIRFVVRLALSGAVGVAIFGMVLPASAGAQTYGGPTPSLSVGSPAAGGTTIVGGSGFGPNTSVSVTIFSTPVLLATVVADANGSVSQSVQIPSGPGFGPGTSHTIQLSGTSPSGAAMVESLALTLAGTSSGGLPLTGHDILPYSVGALALIGVGAAIVVSVKRRPSTV
jgi:hypothetical protein